MDDSQTKKNRRREAMILFVGSLVLLPVMIIAGVLDIQSIVKHSNDATVPKQSGWGVFGLLMMIIGIAAAIVELVRTRERK